MSAERFCHVFKKNSSNRRSPKRKKEKFVKSTPLEPRQRNGFMVPCLKHGTTIEPTSKSGGNLITKSKPNKKEISSNRRLAEATVPSNFPVRDCARIVHAERLCHVFKKNFVKSMTNAKKSRQINVNLRLEPLHWKLPRFWRKIT